MALKIEVVYSRKKTIHNPEVKNATATFTNQQAALWFISNQTPVTVECIRVSEA